MKSPNRNPVTLIATRFAVALTLCAGTASAEDFNPQPDPPGKAQAVEKGAHNPPDDKGVKGKHNPASKTGVTDRATGIPPGFKAGAVDKATGIPPGFKADEVDKATGIPPGFKAGGVDKATGIPPGFKTDKTKKIDAPAVGAIDAEKK